MSNTSKLLKEPNLEKNPPHHRLGGGTKLLHSLKNDLESQNHTVKLINIFNAFDEKVLADQTDLAKNFDVIIGWSLGGQLATLLVDQIAQKYHQNKILITLASNPCFVEHESWQTAMNVSIFQEFKQSFKHDAIATLKKFGYMVCQGVVTTREDFIKLQSLIQPQQITLLEQGLSLLEQLNLVEIIKNYQGCQYHFLAEQDILVSCKVLTNLQQLNAKFLDTELISGSHGFPVFQSDLITGKICQYLQKVEQTA